MKIFKLPSYILLAVLVICCMKSSYGQSKDSTFVVEWDGSFFFKNNEYFSPHAQGWTSLGYWVHPYLEYRLRPSSTVRTGIFYQQYARDISRYRLHPTFSIIQVLTPRDTIILGNIKGGAYHRLSEPLYRRDRMYSHRNEFGIQYIHKSYHWKSDIWLDWDTYIERNDTMQERFFVGIVNDFLLFENADSAIKLSSEGLFTHTGGQVDRSAKPVKNVINASLGINGSISLRPRKTLYTHMKYYYAQGKYDIDATRTTDEVTGSGYSLGIGLRSPSFHVEAEFWSGNNFTTLIGEHLYASNSDHTPSYLIPRRKLLTLGVQYILSRDFGAIEAGGKVYFDTIRKNIDYNFSLFYTFVNRKLI